jgi:hypothetical protein
LQPGGISPEIFEAVESAFFAMKNVHNHPQVIEYDPLAGRKPIHRHGFDLVILSQARLDLARDRFQVGLGRSRADDKEIGEGRDSAQIQDNDLFRLFV